MQLFNRLYLDNKYHCFGGIDGELQRVFILVQKEGAVKHPKLHVDVYFLHLSPHFTPSSLLPPHCSLLFKLRSFTSLVSPHVFSRPPYLILLPLIFLVNELFAKILVV